MKARRARVAKRWALNGWWLSFLGCAQALAAAPDHALPAPAVRAAMQILKAECSACHNPEKKKGGLILTSRESLLRGSDDGAVVVPGEPAASPLLRVLAPDADPHMPPKKQLTEAQVGALRSWVEAGATWDPVSWSQDAAALRAVTLAASPESYQPVLALAWSPDGQKLAVGRGGTVTVHDAGQTNFPVMRRWPVFLDAVQSLAWSGDGRRLAAGAFRRVMIWEGDPLRMAREITNGWVGRVTALQFVPGGEWLAAADSAVGESGWVRIASGAAGRLERSWRAHGDTIFGMDFSRDGERVVTAGGDRLVKVWAMETGKELAALEGHNAQVLAVAFNTNATQVLSAGADKQLGVWDIATRERLAGLGNHAAAVTAASWPGAGALIVAGTEAGRVFTYKNLKAHSGEQSSASADERRLGETGEAILCLAATPDATRFAAGTHDGRVHLWNAEGKRLAQLDVDAVSSGDREVPRAAGLPPAPVAVDWARAFPRVPADPAVEGLRAADVVSLSVDPPQLRLDPGSPQHGLLVTAWLKDGFGVDVTDQARYERSYGAPFEVTGRGQITAARAGSGVLIAHFRGRQARLAVTVEGVVSGTPSVSFVRDVLPVLSRAGCNAGACHAKPEGQNGFKLSVFSYDPKSDYAEIVKEARGRRIFPAAPEESLMVLKPTTALPHEGGLRLAAGSEAHRLLVRWIGEGMNYALTHEPVLAGVEMYPKERRYRPGSRQRLLVQARYSDGGVRDVTRLAAFQSNDKEIAQVDEGGAVTGGALPGQAVVVARYMGFVGDSHVLLPSSRSLPAAQFAALPRHNFIDDLAYAQFQRLGVFPSDPCTDAEFLRRLKLDTVGVLPTPEEVRDFLVDTRPDKRRRVIAEVLDHPAYADYWASKWADLLRPNPDRVGIKSVFMLDQWLRASFRRNEPYDQFVRAILLAEGTNHRDGPAVVYRDRREPPELTTMFSQLFLGTRLECAKCHHHPNEKWGQEDFYQLAAFFGPVKQKGAGLSPPISAGMETFYFAPGGAVKHPVTGETMRPRPPDALAVEIPEGGDPRLALADWLTAPGNTFFARAAVNRVWANFFGRGLVEPVDDFRITNPCVNPELLEALARDFAGHGYDLKHLMRTILESHLYQLSSTPNEYNLADTRLFSRAYRRRLPAEVVVDAVADATSVPDRYAGMPPGARASQAWSYKIESHFLDAFGRPNSSSDCPCERDTHMSVVQSLHLMNAKEIQAKLSHASGRARRLAEGTRSPREIVTELYLATLSRLPTEEELALAAAAFSAAGATRQTATEDVFWALLNSAEFVFNH